MRVRDYERRYRPARTSGTLDSIVVIVVIIVVVMVLVDYLFGGTPVHGVVLEGPGYPMACNARDSTCVIGLRLQGDERTEWYKITWWGFKDLHPGDIVECRAHYTGTWMQSLNSCRVTK